MTKTTKIIKLMKKIILVAAMVLGFAVAASAQPRAIGLRIGNGGEVSYQHQLGRNFVEVDAGLEYEFGVGDFNVGVSGIYNFEIFEPDWSDRGSWGLYAGPGATVGLGIGESNYFTIGAAGMIGIEYSFWFPLQISFDFRQTIGVGLGRGFWAPSSAGVCFRYLF